MEGYDIAQVCTNGHTITSALTKILNLAKSSAVNVAQKLFLIALIATNQFKAHILALVYHPVMFLPVFVLIVANHFHG